MTVRTDRRLWLGPIICSVFLMAPGLASAQDDLDVTMRMVTDDQELDDAFVQQLELPESLDETAGSSDFDTLDTRDTLEPDAGDIADETRDSLLELDDSIAENDRELRDALGDELTGEIGLEEPELDLPGLDDPDLELPGTDDTDLDLLDDDPLNLEDTELQ